MNLIIYGYDAYGDWLSYNGIIRFLLQYYDYIYIITTYIDYVKEMYRDSNKIIIVREIKLNPYNSYLFEYNKNIPKLINIDSNVDELSLCIWDKNPIKKINSTNKFFNNINRIGKFFKIDCIDIKNPPEILSKPDLLKENSLDYENNSTAFYLANGIPKHIKFDYFYYQRNLDDEELLYNKLSLTNKEYIVICEYGDNLIDRKYITNKHIINLHNISKFFDVIKVIENASEVHLIENAVALYVYHMQTKNLMNNIKINLHTYARKEPARILTNNVKSNIYLDMLLQPKLPNWNIIY
jgi:hypothetical protein